MTVADHCPECGGTTQGGCGARWHDTAPPPMCPTCDDSGVCFYPSIEDQALMQVPCPDCSSCPTRGEANAESANAPTLDGDPSPLCPNGCYKRKPLRWADDQWYCPKCGDEFAPDVEHVMSGHSPFLACPDCGVADGSPCPGTVRPVEACDWKPMLDGGPHKNGTWRWSP